jgi:hypothetical protein
VTRLNRSTFTRRQAILAGTALVASAGLAGIRGRLASGSTQAARPTHTWGRIANGGHRDERVLSGLFFAGPPNPNSLRLYTRHPLAPERLDWSDESDILFSLGQFGSAGLNTLKLSYFGHQGETDAFAPAWLFSQRRWPGDGDGIYTEAEQVTRGLQLFHAAAELDLLVAPMLEVGPSFFPFFAQFPDDLDELVDRAAWLLGNFGRAHNYLRLYDRTGEPRHVVWLIESIHLGDVDPREFAAGFDRAAERLHDQLGYRVGFVIDPTPLPAYGSHVGPDPVALQTTSSLLAINPFNITSQGPGAPKPQDQITEDERLAYARSILTTWSGSGIPLIAPVIPGYDAHIVFPGTGVYGFNPDWRLRQQQLALEFATDGLAVDTWNGWTEGYAIPPSEEDGDVHLDWLRGTVADLSRHWMVTDG